MARPLRIRKKRNLARDVAIYLCREMTGETSVVLGRRFDISGAGIAARHDQLAKKLETDRKLKEREHRIRRKILNICDKPFNGRPLFFPEGRYSVLFIKRTQQS
jgi:hypothetical protein